MSCIFNINDLTLAERKKIITDLEVIPVQSAFGKGMNIKPDPILLYQINNNEVSLPYSYVYNNLLNKFNMKNVNEHINYEQTNFSFIATLNGHQKDIHNDAFEILTRTGSILISLACGMGKTIYSIYLCHLLKLKVLVLCHRINLIDQWEYSINKVCPNAKIQVLSSTNTLDVSNDFFIMNVSNVCKRNVCDFEHIGILIVDEAHTTICTENYLQSLFYIIPRYVIFLTATPDRTDGKGQIIELYVGPERITKKIWRLFNVYTVKTKIKISLQYNKIGKVDWNAVLSSQCENENRNKLIVNIITKFKNRNFLVLCKRVEQGRLIKELLKKNKEEDVDTFTGINKTFNKKSRILISTYSKTGVGFDHAKLDALIIASDVEEGIEQYIGRVFRREDTIPIIFDVLDEMNTLKKHYKTRCNLYKSMGGVIYDYTKVFGTI